MDGNDQRMTTHPNAKATQRVADAYAMRIRGATWDEIARALGYNNPSNAHRAVRRFIGKAPQPETGELRSVWRERLEYLWPLAARDVEAQRPGAVRAAVAVAQRAAQMDGLDAPSRVVITPEDAEIEAIVNRLLKRGGIEQIAEPDVLELEAEPIEDEG